MTITELNDKKDSVERAIKACDGANEALTQIAKSVESVRTQLKKELRGLPEEAAEKALGLVESHYVATFNAIGAAGPALNQVRSECYGYRSLLDDIMRATEIDWPPRCAKGKAR